MTTETKKTDGKTEEKNTGKASATVTSIGPGRPRDPKSNIGKTRALMDKLNLDDYEPKAVIDMIVNEVGVKKSVAQVYFYTYRKAIKQREQEAA